MKFKVFSFIPLLFLPISIISTEHNFFELEKISIVNYQKNWWRLYYSWTGFYKYKK